ncbi:glycosyltransferase family 4 protein [Exiguobacterium acetylicum]|uniref:glycosyltransferase family 4 protein n=1 Tax=Exiguobacterium acetylicum TaxID=41170 RepID=UPI002DB9A959|nr:glycosyltransferase family 4 protein [Exiguobacterium indicum]
MKKNKHILVISQYFFPENFRINDICKQWVAKGYKVTVVTGIPNYPQGKFFKGYGFFKKRNELYEGINIIRLPIIARGNSSIRLVLNYLSFVISGGIWSLFSKMKPTHVFIFEVSPMTQALPGVWFAQRKNIPCLLYVQDLWPENVEIVTGIKNPLIIQSIGKMVDYIYKHSTKILTTSNSFINAIENRGVPRDKIQFWPQYAEDFYQVIGNKPDNKAVEELSIVFTGNIGTAQGLEILPLVAARIKIMELPKKIVFTLVGDGRYKSELKKIIFDQDLSEYFYFIDRQPAEKIPEILSKHDVALLTLANNKLFSMTIPAKLQSYMACGMPIIGSVSGESSNIIQESHSGMTSSPEDVEMFIKNLLRFSEISKKDLNIMGANSREYYEQNFNKDKLLKEMDLELENII